MEGNTGTGMVAAPVHRSSKEGCGKEAVGRDNQGTLVAVGIEGDAETRKELVVGE